MPGIPEKPQQLAVVPVPDGGERSETVPQPRQPTSLQGLLRFAMDATKTEDAAGEGQFQQMDEEVYSSTIIYLIDIYQVISFVAKTVLRKCFKINDSGCN